MELTFIFRKPKFPMLANIEGHFIGAKTPKDLLVKLSRIQLDQNKHYQMVDSTAEGWTLSTEGMIISPLTFKKRWSKLEIIQLFNKRENKELAEGAIYSEKSLSAKRRDRIISDLVELSSQILYGK